MNFVVLLLLLWYFCSYCGNSINSLLILRQFYGNSIINSVVILVILVILFELYFEVSVLILW